MLCKFGGRGLILFHFDLDTILNLSIAVDLHKQQYIANEHTVAK